MQHFLVNEDFKDIVVERLLKLGYKDETFSGGSLPFAPWVNVDVNNRSFKCCRFSVSPGKVDYWHQLRWQDFLTIHNLLAEGKPLDDFIATLDEKYKGLSHREFPKQ